MTGLSRLARMTLLGGVAALLILAGCAARKAPSSGLQCPPAGL